VISFSTENLSLRIQNVCLIPTYTKQSFARFSDLFLRLRFTEPKWEFAFFQPARVTGKPAYRARIRCASRRYCERHPVKLGLEGVVGKRIDSVYELGERSGAWIKLRANMEQEFVIGGYIPGARGFDGLLVGVYEKRELIFVAKVKNGFVEFGMNSSRHSGRCKSLSVPSRICPRKGPRGGENR
jgi:hypothetical protein